MDNINSLIILSLIVLLIITTIYSFNLQQENIKNLTGLINTISNDDMIDIEIERDVLRYSNDLLSYGNDLVKQVAESKFLQFKESKDLSKITESHIKILIEDISKTIHSSINFNIIDFEGILFNEEFFQNYIIMKTIHEVSLLLEKER